MFEPNTIHQGDCRELITQIEDDSVHCCVTSPPYYGKRDYGVSTQLGLEESPRQYIDNLVSLCGQVRRVLRPDGTFWLNVGDSYTNLTRTYYASGEAAGKNNRKGIDVYNGARKALKGNDMGLKEKDLMMLPHRLAIALQEDGWWVRSEIVWAKPNPTPESVRDRPTSSHEFIFLLTKCPQYYYDWEAISTSTQPESFARSRRGVSAKHKNLTIPGQTPHSMHKARANGEGYKMGERANRRDVWFIEVAKTRRKHYATYPEKLVELCILAGCPEGGTVFDPFMGSGTTAVVARRLKRNYLGFELSKKYCAIAHNRLRLPFEPVVTEDDEDFSDLPMFAQGGK